MFPPKPKPAGHIRDAGAVSGPDQNPPNNLARDVPMMTANTIDPVSMHFQNRPNAPTLYPYANHNVTTNAPGGGNDLASQPRSNNQVLR